MTAPENAPPQDGTGRARRWVVPALLGAYLVYAWGFIHAPVCLAYVPGPLHYAPAYAGMVAFGVAGVWALSAAHRARAGRGPGARGWVAILTALESFAIVAFIGTTIYPNSGCPVWPFV